MFFGGAGADGAVSYLFRYIGQVLGVAFSSAILQSVLQSDLTRTIKGPDAKSVSLVLVPGPG